MTEDTFVTVAVPKKAGLVFEVQNIPGTGVWAVVQKGDFLELVEKARLYDLESHDRLSYEADKLSREFSLEHPIGLTEMIAADVNSKAVRQVKGSDAWRALR